MRERFADGTRDVGVAHELAEAQVGDLTPHIAFKVCSFKRKGQHKAFELSFKVGDNLAFDLAQELHVGPSTSLRSARDDITTLASLGMTRAAPTLEGAARDGAVSDGDDEIEAERRRNPKFGRPRIALHRRHIKGTL